MISFLMVVLITLIENDDHLYKKIVNMVNIYFFLMMVIAVIVVVVFIKFRVMMIVTVMVMTIMIGMNDDDDGTSCNLSNDASQVSG